MLAIIRVQTRQVSCLFYSAFVLFFYLVSPYRVKFDLIRVTLQQFPWGFVFKRPWDFHGLFWGPTDRVWNSFNFFCASLTRICA